jgi:hypothetical protein
MARSCLLAGGFAAVVHQEFIGRRFRDGGKSAANTVMS